MRMLHPSDILALYYAYYAPTFSAPPPARSRWTLRARRHHNIKRRACDMRPLWRDLILKVWGGDPLRCPCCQRTMKSFGLFLRREEIEFFLRLHGLWQDIIHLPRPPPPPFDIETMEPIEPPWLAIKEWIAGAPLGNLRKYHLVTAAPWFLRTPD